MDGNSALLSNLSNKNKTRHKTIVIKPKQKISRAIFTSNDVNIHNPIFAGVLKSKMNLKLSKEKSCKDNTSNEISAKEKEEKMKEFVEIKKGAEKLKGFMKKFEKTITEVGNGSIDEIKPKKTLSSIDKIDKQSVDLTLKKRTKSEEKSKVHLLFNNTINPNKFRYDNLSNLSGDQGIYYSEKMNNTSDKKALHNSYSKLMQKEMQIKSNLEKSLTSIHNSFDSSNLFLIKGKENLDSIPNNESSKKFNENIFNSPESIRISEHPKSKLSDVGFFKSKKSINKTIDKSMSNISETAEKIEDKLKVKDSSESSDSDDLILKISQTSHTVSSRLNRSGVYSKDLEYVREVKKQTKIIDSNPEESETEDDVLIPYQKDENSFFLIEHKGDFYQIWNIIVIFTIAIAIIYCPLAMASGQTFYSYDAVIYIIIEIIYFLDLFMNFFVTFTNDEDIIVRDFSFIIQNYVTTWFFLDLIACLPLSIFIERVNKIMILRNRIVILFISIKNSIKGCKMFDLYKSTYSYVFELIGIDKGIKKNEDKKLRLQDEARINSGTKRLIKSIFGFFVITHFISCLWIFLGKGKLPNWIFHTNQQDDDFFSLYISAIYYNWTTIFTIGYGDITPRNMWERVYTLLLEFFGVLVYSFFISSLGNILANYDELTIKFMKNMDILNDLKIKYTLDDKFYDKVSKYINYNYKYGKHEKAKFFQELPARLRLEMLLVMYKDVIKEFKFFKYVGNNNEFISRMLIAFRSMEAVKKEVIVNEFDYFEELILVKNGVLSICMGLKFNEEKVMNLRKTEHFGDIMIVAKLRSNIILKVASKTAELLLIKRSELEDIIQDFMPICKKILKVSSYNYTKLLEIMLDKMKNFQKSHEKNSSFGDDDLNLPEIRDQFYVLDDLNEHLEKGKNIRNFNPVYVDNGPKKNSLFRQAVDSKTCIEINHNNNLNNDKNKLRKLSTVETLPTSKTQVINNKLSTKNNVEMNLPKTSSGEIKSDFFLRSDVLKKFTSPITNVNLASKNFNDNASQSEKSFSTNKPEINLIDEKAFRSGEIDINQRLINTESEIFKDYSKYNTQVKKNLTIEEEEFGSSNSSSLGKYNRISSAKSQFSPNNRPPCYISESNESNSISYVFKKNPSSIFNNDIVTDNNFVEVSDNKDDEDSLENLPESNNLVLTFRKNGKENVTGDNDKTNFNDNQINAYRRYSGSNGGQSNPAETEECFNEIEKKYNGTLKENFFNDMKYSDSNEYNNLAYSRRNSEVIKSSIFKKPSLDSSNRQSYFKTNFSNEMNYFDKKKYSDSSVTSPTPDRKYSDYNNNSSCQSDKNFHKKLGKFKTSISPTSTSRKSLTPDKPSDRIFISLNNSLSIREENGMSFKNKLQRSSKLLPSSPYSNFTTNYSRRESIFKPTSCKDSPITNEIFKRPNIEIELKKGDDRRQRMKKSNIIVDSISDHFLKDKTKTDKSGLLKSYIQNLGINKEKEIIKKHIDILFRITNNLVKLKEDPKLSKKFIELVREEIKNIDIKGEDEIVMENEEDSNLSEVSNNETLK